MARGIEERNTKIGETLSERLRRLRSASGLSVSAVASRIGVPPSTYREWEYGRAIRGEPYVALSEVLRVGLHELLTGRNLGAAEALPHLETLEIATRELRRILGTATR